VPKATGHEKDASGGIVNISVICVPHGAQYDAKSDRIVYADGSSGPPPPFQAFTPTPALDLLPAPVELPVAVGPLAEPSVVDIEPERNPKLVVLNTYRRERDDPLPDGS
jgi:hypothetical protein